MCLHDILETYKRGHQAVEERNRLQIELIKGSELDTLTWVKTYAAKFDVVYSTGERELGTIKTILEEL